MVSFNQLHLFHRIINLPLCISEHSKYETSSFQSKRFVFTSYLRNKIGLTHFYFESGGKKEIKYTVSNLDLTKSNTSFLRKTKSQKLTL